MALKEHHSGKSMSQLKLLRTKLYFGILQSSVISILKLDYQILLIIDKTKKEVKNTDVTTPGDVWVNEREVGKV